MCYRGVLRVLGAQESRAVGMVVQLYIFKSASAVYVSENVFSHAQVVSYACKWLPWTRCT